MQIVIASRNLHKIRELREMLRPYKRLDILSLLNFPQYEPSLDKGKTFQENAQLKAIHAANALQKLVLADDSGLVVPAIGGAPGILSSEYAGEDSTDSENRKKLLESMSGLSEMQRTAYFECCLALANPTGLIKSAIGSCEGIILREERGRNGFGYDPLFMKTDYDKTFGELEEVTKIRISHSRKAFEKIATTLETL